MNYGNFCGNYDFATAQTLQEKCIIFSGLCSCWCNQFAQRPARANVIALPGKRLEENSKNVKSNLNSTAEKPLKDLKNVICEADESSEKSENEIDECDNYEESDTSEDDQSCGDVKTKCPKIDEEQTFDDFRMKYWILECPKNFDPQQLICCELKKQDNKGIKFECMSETFNKSVTFAVVQPTKVAEYQLLCDGFKFLVPVGKIVVSETNGNQQAMKEKSQKKILDTEISSCLQKQSNIYDDANSNKITSKANMNDKKCEKRASKLQNSLEVQGKDYIEKDLNCYSDMKKALNSENKKDLRRKAEPRKIMVVKEKRCPAELNNCFSTEMELTENLCKPKTLKCLPFLPPAPTPIKKKKTDARRQRK
ncbi:CLUMA_CG008278, isoform A [Clunio marinus]|uniref:CLUMA_CG008278, isoform A n=1 Tax=Clunio marinus TaxID=568069 RepID=A0A1J1I3A1_9DIPT|nr:CLUMA_CG008278, isoform A [Clunio marinus]